jgi:hypothetical protein
MNFGELVPLCDCLDQYRSTHRFETQFHGEVQDTGCDGWKRLVELIEAAAADGRNEFSPGQEIPRDEWRQVVTLPTSIATLKAVRRFVLYGSWLVRIPPEIGEMESLESFEPYTSHRLHWFPYEITRCTKLRRSIVSTRSLYGNFKYRPPFPSLQPATASAAALDLAHLAPAVWGVEAVARCSVCGNLLSSAELHQAWLSALVGTDVLPLLVNACSDQCVRKLPAAAEGYVRTAHRGGSAVQQPPPCR